jgi:rSAM/selenodomain-associated transferase 1
VDKPVKKVENPLFSSPSPPLWRARPGTLGIFAKEPQPGRVKTRLCPPLSLAEAAQVHHLSLQQTVTALAPLQPLIFYSGDIAYFQKNFPGIPLLPQSDGDLGVRMAQALCALHARGNERALLVGSDAPDLPRQLIIDAYTALASAAVVTIPARDGGYVLIGERGHHPPLFCEVAWSTPAVLAQTRTICAAQQLPYAEIGQWEDVDDAAALLRLSKRAPTLAVSIYAAGVLRNYGVVG